MNSKKNTYILLIILAIFSACQDPWEERTTLNQDVPFNNLMQEIDSKLELSLFAEYLRTTGWDTLLSASKFYTVWAPTNEALSKIDKSIINNPEYLKDLINYHICYSQFNYLNANGLLRLNTFRSKYLMLDYNNRKVNDANLIEPLDNVANNGVLHIVDKALVPQMNVWEFIESMGDKTKLTKYINSFSGEIFDPYIATQIGFDPETGKPMYDTATGLIWDNVFLNQTRDLRNEDTLSTVILFSDADFQNEFDKYRDYYTVKTGIYPNYVVQEEETDSVTIWKISKDIVFKGQIAPNELPDKLTSLFNVNITTNSFSIDSVYQASNGYVYVVNNYSVKLADKIHSILIEAEDTNRYIGRDPFGKTGFTRKISLASGGFDFVLDDHGGNPGTITYRIPGDLCNGVDYILYYKAVNDFNYSYKSPNDTTRIFQRIGYVTPSYYEDGEPVFDDFEAPFTTAQLEVVDSLYSTAKEDSVGMKKIFRFNEREWIQIRGNSKNSTIAFDYIKLVPVLN